MGGDYRAAGSRRFLRVGRVIYGADNEIASWVGRRIPGYVMLPGAVALGVERNGKIVAGVVYERCNGANIEASIAAVPGSRWADRDVLRQIFAYPFLQLGVAAVTVLVAHSNLPALHLATKMGFSPIALVPFAAHDRTALVILQAYRDQCRWIRHGQEGRKRAGGA